MGTTFVFLMLLIGLGIWGYIKPGVLLVFTNFFYLSLSISLRGIGSDASTMLIRFGIFAFFIFLHILRGNSGFKAIRNLFKSRLFLGYLLILLIGYISAIYSSSLVADKLSNLQDSIIYVVVPMALFIMYYGNYRDITDFPLYFAILTIISLISVLGFLDTSALVLDSRQSISSMGGGIGSIFLSRLGAIALICSILVVYYCKHFWHRLIGIVSSFVALFYLMLSSQRASIIGFLTAVLVWIYFGINVQKNIRPIIIIGFLLIGIVAMNVEQFAVLDRFRDLENYQEYERYGDYETSLRLFIEKPLFGHGLMGYYEQTGRQYPHNLFLEVMVEYGFLGLLIYFAMLSEVFGVIRRIFSKPNANHGMQAIALSWIALFVVTLFAGNFTGSSIFFILSGIIISIKQGNLVQDSQLKQKINIDLQDKSELHHGSHILSS